MRKRTNAKLLPVRDNSGTMRASTVWKNPAAHQAGISVVDACFTANAVKSLDEAHLCSDVMRCLLGCATRAACGQHLDTRHER